MIILLSKILTNINTFEYYDKTKTGKIERSV
jgi:hypothetical protein